MTYQGYFGYFKSVDGENLQIGLYDICRLINHSRTIGSIPRRIPYSVSLHSKHVKVMQGHAAPINKQVIVSRK